MSGGAMGYLCFNMKDHADQIPDREIRELFEDMAALMHALEWYLSSDTSEGHWLHEAAEFRKKWLRNDGKERLREYVDKICTEQREELMEMIGMAMHCEDCIHFHREEGTIMFGQCDFHKNHLDHFYSKACEKFKGD